MMVPFLSLRWGMKYMTAVILVDGNTHTLHEKRKPVLT